MKEVVDYIDQQLAICYPNYKYWGLGEIVTKSKDVFPVTVQSREKICLDDAYDAVIWHREVSATQQEDDEFSFGLKTETRYIVTLRTIVAYKIEVGEEFKFIFPNSFPREIPLSGYQIFEVIAGSMNINHEQVAQEEEIHTQYNKHRICWNIFSFENELQFIFCPDSELCTTWILSTGTWNDLATWNDSAIWNDGD